VTLGEFSTAVGAPKRWVQNAMAVLDLPAVYTVEAAKRLSFARTLNEACGMALVDAYPLADEALAEWPAQRTWILEGTDGVATLSVDLQRFLSNFAVRLSLSRNYYAELKRGRPRTRRKRGVAAAREYGVDIGLLRESLKLTPEERLRRLEDALAFLQAARVVD
jgi:hypothetical protein